MDIVVDKEVMTIKFDLICFCPRSKSDTAGNGGVR